MTCMKCGKDTKDGQVFCDHCRESMEAYPVKPDAHIQLPIRNIKAAPKKQIRKKPTKDAQVASLRLQIRWMWVVILALLLAIGALLAKSI